MLPQNRRLPSQSSSAAVFDSSRGRLQLGLNQLETPIDVKAVS